MVKNVLLENNDIIYNLDYIVCMPQYDYDLYEAFEYSFKNVFVIKDNVSDTNKIVNFIKNNNIKKVILVDFLLEYNKIIKTIDLDIEIKFILTKALASITNFDIYSIVNSVFELHKKNVYKELGVLDINWFKCLKTKQGINVKYIRLDIQNIAQKNDMQLIKNNSNTIGILSEEYNADHSFFNQLSAIELNGKYIPNLKNDEKNIKDFCNVFNIKYKYSSNSDYEKYINENKVNLYINFTDSNNILFLKSMDASIPCILGNTCLLNDYHELKRLITVNSDDDVNEISEKIDNIIENKDKVLELYKNFRIDYSKKSKKDIHAFLNIEENVEDVLEEMNEKMLSVIVPVYNTEKYISDCIESIINSKFEDMEIIVINDGSTDNSEIVIKEYINKYPKIIKYIKQENHGLGNVRNVGLKNAKGKYIFSVDSDDTINVQFLKEAEKYMKNDVDMVICDWLSIPENGENFETAAIDYIFKDINPYKGLLYTTIMPSTCNKIIKRNIFKRIKYNYAEGLKYEDLSLNPIIMIEAKSIKYINKPYYEYKIRGNSIMRTNAGYNMIDVLELLDSRISNMYNNYCKINLEEFKYYTYTWRIEEFIFNQIYDMEDEEISEFVEYTISKIENILKEIYFSPMFTRCLDNFKNATRDYVNKRNQALKNGKLVEFLKKAKKEKNYIKITPPMFFYGEK